MKVKVRLPRRKNQLATEEGARTLEATLAETAKACEEMLTRWRKLQRSERASDAYLDQLPDIAVCAAVLNAKTETIERKIDAIEDTLPD
jgi:hypothetical protein